MFFLSWSSAEFHNSGEKSMEDPTAIEESRISPEMKWVP